MNSEQKSHCDNLMLKAKELAESKFSATFVAVGKNVLLLRKKSAGLTSRAFLTIKVNLHNMSFHDGHYDMDFDNAIENFKGRVEDSSFNPKLDTPAVNGGQ